MKEITRRTFLAATGGFGILSASTKKTDIRIEDMSSSYEDYLYRAPIKFGGTVVDRATLLNVNCTVRTASGQVAKGFGSMPLGNVWAFPSKKMPYDTTLAAMKALAQEIIKITAEVSQRLNLAEPIPTLCTLVTSSAIDAAVHDAYGKVHGLNCYHTYGPEFMNHDLSHYLGAKYKGEYPSRYIQREP